MVLIYVEQISARNSITKSKLNFLNKTIDYDSPS